ncbi:FecR family protein [Spirosoma sp.]|uniref:FecR family protein n=1 Tax=Spirosoma sp. TaxID=1899569 RepID=UPI003B3AAC3A
MKPPPIAPDLLDKYLRNECTDQEKQQVEAWYASLHGDSDFLSSLPETEQRQLQNETFATIQDNLGMGHQPVVRRISWGWAAGLAASVLLIIGFYVTYQNWANPTTALNQTASQPSGLPDAVNTIRYVNQQARPVMHTLPDGSSVWMHAGAAITYPKKFDTDKRQVAFSGEGFFDVRKDKHAPFYIQSGEMTIKVLGTSFNVKALNSRKVFQIAVVTGRVQVSAPDRDQNEQQVILKPQQQATFEIESKRLVAAPVPAQIKKEMYEPITVVFDNAPLDQVIDKLQKRYHVTFRLTNPKLTSCRVSADFEHQALPTIMEMLCTALDVTYTMTGNTILIDGIPCE